LGHHVSVEIVHVYHEETAVRFAVLMMVNVTVQSFWDVKPCNVVNGYLSKIWHFLPPYYMAS
jgi:hypothetical protein